MTTDNTWVDKIFTASVAFIVDFLSLLTLALLVCATGLLAYKFYDGLVAWEPGKLRHVAIDIFTVFVFIEVTQLFRNFRHGTGLALLDVIEISFLLVMREFAILAIEGTLESLTVLGIAAVLATLSVGWWLVAQVKREPGTLGR